MRKAKTKTSSLPTSAASRHTTPLRGYFLSSRFICEATNHSSSRFCYEATGGEEHSKMFARAEEPRPFGLNATSASVSVRLPQALEQRVLPFTPSIYCVAVSVENCNRLLADALEVFFSLFHQRIARMNIVQDYDSLGLRSSFTEFNPS